MALEPKPFAGKFKECLDSAGVPQEIHARARILSKMLGIQTHVARSLLDGRATPNEDLLEKISSAFGIDKDSLAGHQHINKRRP